MKKSDFKKAMQCGLGRCILELSTCSDKEKYREIVLWGCLHNLSFDTQCEGTRSEYLYELVSAYHNDDYFLQPVIEKFEKLSPAKRSWDFAHFSDLLCCFAGAGSASARTALHKKYDEIYRNLLEKRKSSRYGIYVENYERISIAIVSLEGLNAFIKIATDTGNLLLTDAEYEGFDLAWLYMSSENQVGKRELASAMERESKKSAAVRTYYEKVKRERAQLHDINKNPTDCTAEDIVSSVESGKVGYGDYVRFRRTANEEQKLLLVQAVLNEPDPDKKAKLLKAFRISGFPICLEEIISYAKCDHEELRKIALDVLTDSIGIPVHDFAIGILRENPKSADAVSMLILNYQEQDKDLLLSILHELEVDYSDKSGWHEVAGAILNAFERKVKLPKEALLFIYNRSLCSVCREYAVRELIKHRWLSDVIKAECVLDSNFDIREYIAKRR